MQKGVSREELTKWLANKFVPWKRRRRLLQAITLSFPSSAWLHKIGKAASDSCAACKKIASRQGFESEAIAKGTYGHIQSAACKATKEAVTAAHNKCCNALCRALAQHRKAGSNIEFVEDDKDVSFKKIWERSALMSWCTAEEVEQAAKWAQAELQCRPTANESQTEANIERFWKQRPDRVAVDSQKRVIYIVEFKRTIDLRPNFQAEAEARATRQHEWLAKTLSKIGERTNWTVQVIIFTGGTLGSVDVKSFENSLKTLEVKKERWNQIRKMLARELLEAHDNVLQAYFGTLYDNCGPEMHPKMHVAADVYL